MLKRFLIIPVAVFIASYLLPFVYWPEMLNWPFFISQGWFPYKDIAIVHTPLLLGFLTGFYNIFGYNTWALHLFGSLLLVMTTLLVGLITKKISPQIIFGLLVLALSGNTVWFESLLAPVLLLLFWAFKNKKFILAGILFGVAFITKQTVAYLLPVMILSLWRQKPKTIFYFGFAVLIPISLLTFWLITNNLLPDFWRWGIQFVFLKTSEASGQNAYFLLPSIKPAFIILTLIAIPLIFSRNTAFIWMLFSLLFAVPRFDYFHLVPFAAFLSISVGTAKFKSKFLVMIILFSAVTLIILTRSSLKQDHSFLDKNTLMVANYVEGNLKGKSVFFLNSYDQVYFLTKNLSGVRPWIPQLPWYFGFYGDRFLFDIQRSTPQIIIVSPYLNKAVGGLGAYRPAGVLEYINQNYVLIYTFSEGTKVFERVSK